MVALMTALLRRSNASAATRAARRFSSRTVAGAGNNAEALRPIHFTEEDEDPARPFRIVGVRDVEVQDWELPTRIEAEQRGERVLRNRFQHPNFISLWVDKLSAVEAFLKQEKIPVADGGIVKGPEGLDVLVVPPAEDGSLELFNLSDAPAMVELVQATEEVVREFEEDREFVKSQEFDTTEAEAEAAQQPPQ